MIEVTETVEKLIQMMEICKLKKETALIIGTNLPTEEQQMEMINYLKRYQKIMTDHQALQHLQKILEVQEKKKD